MQAVSVRVKRGKLGPDLLLNMRLKHTIEHVSLEILALGVPLPCPQALAGSVLPTQVCLNPKPQTLNPEP